MAPFSMLIFMGLSEIPRGAVGMSTLRFTGLENILELLSDEYYTRSLINTFIFVITNLNVKIPMAFLIALALNRNFKGRRILTALLLVPWAIPGLPYYTVWRFMYYSDVGVLNYILTKIGIANPPQWIADPRYALYSVMIAHAIKNIPFFAIVLLAGLQSIPTELYESAEIDGAGGWQKLRYITLPLMKNLIVLNYILSFIWMMGVFDPVWIITHGGPAYSSNVLGTYAYVKTFELMQPNLGIASFLPIAPLILALVILLIWKRIIRLGGE